MRPGQNRRMRGRNNNNNNNNNGNRKAPNPLQRSYESNGPDVKVRGTAQHVAEKYLQLARDAQSSGDPVAAENYFQHAEHYYRILLAAQEQMAQQFGHSFPPNRAFGEDGEDGEDENEDEGVAFPQGSPQPDMRNQSMGLIRTILKSANLERLNARGANLSRVDLEFASLRGADLTDASLNGAQLGGADLTGVTVIGTDFDGADLASVRLVAPIGLDRARNFDKARNADRLIKE